MGNSHSTPTITPRDLERWDRDGRPVLIERSRRRRSPGGRYHDEHRHRFIREGSGGRFAFERDYDPRPPRWRGGSSGRARDVSPPFLSARRAGRDDDFFADRPRARAGRLHADPLFGPNTVHGWGRGPGAFERAPRFGRPPVIVEEVGFDFFPSHHRFAPSGHRVPHRRPPMPASFGGPGADDVPPRGFRGPPHPPRSRSMPPPFNDDLRGGPYMSGGLGRGDPVGGARRPERAPESGRIGFRPEFLLEDGRADD